MSQKPSVALKSASAAVADRSPDNRRERGKRDKRRRLIEAARAVFIECGYEAATTRDIAARADVSVGTLFVYAKDKRDLLLQIVNDDLDAITARGQAVLDRPGPVLERLVAYFRLRYRYWASEPRLARPALRATANLFEPGEESGEEARRFYSRSPLMREQIEQMLRAEQAAGGVAADVAVDEVATLLFNLYLIEARSWLRDEQPRLAAGVAALQRVLALFLRGILLAPAAEVAAAPRAPAAARRVQR